MVISDADFDEANLSLSFETKDGERKNVTYAAKFTHDEDTWLRLGPDDKLYTQTIDLPFKIINIYKVGFYSNSESTSTFLLEKVAFDPIYLSGNFRRLSRKIFHRALNLSGRQKHQTWYTFKIAE